MAHTSPVRPVIESDDRGRFARIILAMIATMAMVVTLLALHSFQSSSPAAAVTDEDPAFVLNQNDLEFILRQIQISEAHAAGGQLRCASDTDQSGKCVNGDARTLGVRTVSGSENNLLVGQAAYGASDHAFPRLLPAEWRQADPDPAPATPGADETEAGFPVNTPDQVAMCENGLTCYDQRQGIVYDSDPRTISNLVVDQTLDNPAIVNQLDAGTAVRIPGTDRVVIPNTAADEELSAPFNTFLGFFGQFFDHGLDLVDKGGNGTLIVPLQPDDPLYVEGSDTNFIALSRADRIEDGSAPDTEHQNLTTPFIDQNQTYSSHPSHQVFLREYDADAQVTGLLLEGDLGGGERGGLATWNDVKAQARDILGIDLTDADLLDVPLLMTDQYGHFIPGENGLPQLAVADDTAEGGVAFVEGDTANPISTENALGTGHAFLDDIAHGSTPVLDEATGELLPRFDENGQPLLDENGQPVLTGYDNVTLGEHFVAGDGRVNENIGLTAVHHVFHAEHNRLIGEIEELLNGEHPELESEHGMTEFAKAFRGEAHAYPSAKAGQELPQPEGDDWSYRERLFQAAKFATEMQYQHLVFEEFGRKIAPTIDEVVFNENSYNAGVNPSIFAEFAHVVYRFGHSMMSEEIGREPVVGGQSVQDVPLVQGFLNPDLYDLDGALSPEEAAGSLINGMTARVGNQIDEHIVDVLRNNLLGQPLDLATLNLLRGRDVGIPPLQDARRTFYGATNEPSLRPYASWFDFGQNIKNGNNFGRGGNNASLVNFVAAYGTHPSILDATTLEEKRDAAALLVNGAPLGEEFLTRYGGSDRYHTAQLVAEASFNAPVPVAYIAAGMNFPDALAGGPAAAANGGPILLAGPVDSGEIPLATRNALRNLEPARIVVLGGPGAVGEKTVTALNQLFPDDKPVTRLYGADRFETAAEISTAEFAPGVERVFIANGMNFPDALTGAAVAARDGSPILLVRPDSIPPATAAALRALDPGEIVVLGETAAVSAPVFSRLGGFTDGDVIRLGGATRYETALEISKHFFPTGADTLYIATGATFPDALTATPAAGLDSAPMLIVPPSGLTPAIRAEISRLSPDKVIVLGGPAAVSIDIEFALSAYAPEPLVAPADRQAFMLSQGAWANLPTGETITGVDDVDFWVGGLAERLNPFGGMLGSTFNFVFEKQLENLQFGDRFYYLFRNQGQQLFAALEGNTFADLIQRNTDASHLPADVFALHDPILDLEALPDPLPGGLLHEADGTWRWDGDEHVEIHGTAEADRIRGDEGDDALWGYDGDDVIEGGAGNDALVGGHGDDIITDSFGDDNIKGMQGDDAINAGPGIDLTIGGLGDDFIMGGGDPKTTFAGMGDDVVLGTSGRMTVFGGEHDDWVEGSSHADLLQGDNADQFQTDTLGGNDVVVGGLGNDDIEGEGGDDILIGLAVGTDRHLGNLGWDWLTYYGETRNVNADFAFSRVFQQQNPLPSRFDHLEAVSGGQGNDTLRGAMVQPDDLMENEIPLTKATEDSLALIDGLNELLRPAGAPTDYAAPFLRGTPESDTDGVHEVMIGGLGSDVIEGRGGNDFLDGDAMLRVQLVHTPTGERFDSAAQVQARVFSGEIDPGDLDIVREIVVDEDDAAASLDTAFYNNPIGSYEITALPDGYWRIAHVQVAEPEESDGTDVFHGFEVLQFADGCATLNEAGDAWEPCEVTAELVLSTDSPVEDQAVTATLQQPGGDPFDATGVTNVQYTWWAGEGADAANVTEWEPLAVLGVGAGQNPTTSVYTPTDLAVDQFLRVTLSYRDAGGFFRTATSPVTTNTVQNVNDVPTLPLIVASPSGLLTVTPPFDGDGFNEDDPGFTYQWFSDGAVIDGATQSTYTPGAEAAGTTITVQVFYTDLFGTAESPTSAGYVVP